VEAGHDDHDLVSHAVQHLVGKSAQQKAARVTMDDTVRARTRENCFLGVPEGLEKFVAQTLPLRLVPSMCRRYVGRRVAPIE
jgi:hypothetical protein